MRARFIFGGLEAVGLTISPVGSQPVPAPMPTPRVLPSVMPGHPVAPSPRARDTCHSDLCFYSTDTIVVYTSNAGNPQTEYSAPATAAQGYRLTLPITGIIGIVDAWYTADDALGELAKFRHFGGAAGKFGRK